MVHAAISAFFPLGGGLTIFVSQYFQAVRKPLFALTIGLSRQILFELPLVYLLPRIFGYSGVVFSAPVGDAIASILAFFLIRREILRLRSRMFLGAGLPSIAGKGLLPISGAAVLPLPRKG